jgi:TPR repeat protein
MANINVNSQDVEKIKQTTCWLLMAALNNEPQAQFSMANIFYYGNAIFTPDKEQAREFFEKCIPFLLKSKQDIVQNVFANSLYKFAEMHELGKGGLVASGAVAVKYYQEAANREDPEAHLNLGHFYATGRDGLPKDYTKAIFHYNKAIEIFRKPGTFLSSISPKVLANKLAESHYNAGLAYHGGGFGLNQNHTLAADHFRKASSEVVKALFMYGLQLYMGQGIHANKKEGLKLLIAAADKGLKISAVNLMTLYFEGEVVPYLESNFTKEQLLRYMLLAKDESPWLISKLACYYLNEKNYDKANEYIQLGFKLEQAEAIGYFANLYENGCPQLKISQDYKIAYKHYCQAAELGSYNALNAKGYMLLYGLGVNKDEAKAKVLFEQCLGAGFKLSAYNLSAIYRFGLGVTRDLNESFKYLSFAEACEDEDVLFTLGYCLCEGEGTEPDYKRGQEYLRRAAEKGHIWASFNCAIFCLNEASQSGSLDDNTSQTILKYLEVPVALGYARAIYLRAMVKLYQQPTNIKTVIGELEASERIRPYIKTKFVLQFLKKQTQITKSQVLNILFAKNILSMKDIETALNPVDSKTVLDAIKPGDRAKLVLDSTLTLSGSAAAKANTSNQTQRLKSAMDDFTDPLQRKNAKVDTLNTLVGRLFKLKGITAKISSSKGSGVKYRVELPNSNPICFSGPDARLHAKRGRDMQKFVDEIRETLVRSHM